MVASYSIVYGQTKNPKTDSVFKTIEKEGFQRSEPRNIKPLIILEDYPFISRMDSIPAVNTRELAYDSLNKIDPNAIETIHVLKGKQATDAYGNKGENGVIVIRIKKGKQF
jgi:hypothetical protein